MQPQKLQELILHWYDTQKRMLPWRSSRDPYRIWVSEIMLQQTRAQAVIPYYLAFMERFPTVSALADASEQDVLKGWEGLGYYSRARNLHRAAQCVARDMGGIFPLDAAGLRALPGVGEYTAGMIASIAYNEPAPAIDGNQIRVLSRLFLMDAPARTRDGMDRLRVLASSLISRERPGDFNQALMDMGALFCRAGNPRCEECPALGLCEAQRTGEAQRLPVLPAKRIKREERRLVAVVVRGKRVLVEKRPSTGLLGGLWQFPNFVGDWASKAGVQCLRELGVEVRSIRVLPDVTHVFTHLVWNMRGRLYRAKETPEIPGCRWVDMEELVRLPMPTAMKIYREEAQREL